MKKWIALAVVVALAGTGAYLRFRSESAPTERYRFTKVDRGDVESVVSSTGTLSAVSTVQVGTQVSGSIARILVDFNEKVTRGQLLAVLDTTFLATTVRDAEASYERARSSYEHNEQEFQRLQPLFSKGMAAQTELDMAKFNRDQAKAGLKSAQAALDRARVNLRYAWIYAPIDGTVIDRKVDGGQTVAASLSAPTLFLIANDLSRMQILANVDESDIGQIANGQAVRFTVQAYPERRFTGTVAQIRLQPTTVQNVVNYTVVVNVDNPDGLLLPGMTATIEFLIARSEGVLRVANAALRFRPPASATATPGSGERTATTDSSRGRGSREGRSRGGEGRSGEGRGSEGRGSEGGGRGGAPDAMAAGGFGGRGAGRESSRLWFLDSTGALQSARVRTGVSDGQVTEIRTDELSEGQEVITGVVTAAATTTQSTSPLMNAGPPGMGGGGMGRGRGPGF